MLTLHHYDISLGAQKLCLALAEKALAGAKLGQGQGTLGAGISGVAT